MTESKAKSIRNSTVRKQCVDDVFRVNQAEKGGYINE
jgi:hypothetical protein